MKRALVTGSSAGLGAAIARRLLAQDWQVIGIDRQAASNADAGMTTIPADLSSRAAVDRVLVEAIGEGPFDCVVLNAGVSASGRFEKIPPAAHLALLAVDAEAPLVMAQGLLAADCLAPGAALVFVSSLSHFTGYPGAASYGAAKDVVAVYAKSLRKPLKARGLTVTLACPGPMRTDHAARHAPPDASADKRMDADVAAQAILSATMRGRFLMIPGAGPTLAGLFGRLAPGLAARAMRRLIYQRLDRNVW